MAFKTSNLSVLAYANGFTLWHYKTTDTSAIVKTADYFSELSKIVNAGDFIFTNAADKSVIIAVISTENETVAITEM